MPRSRAWCSCAAPSPGAATTSDGHPTDWEAWEVETAEWGLHLFVIIEPGWVLVGEPT